MKLVRGAYHDQELSRHTKARELSGQPQDNLPPVWSNKSETDACYNEVSKGVRWFSRASNRGISQCATRLIHTVGVDIRSSHESPGIGVLFGTHNWQSCEIVMDCLVKEELATVDGKQIVVSDAVANRVSFGQLLGMTARNRSMRLFAHLQPAGMSNALTDHIAQAIRAPSPMVLK